jgi:hypothetical protein
MLFNESCRARATKKVFRRNNDGDKGGLVSLFGNNHEIAKNGVKKEEEEEGACSKDSSTSSTDNTGICEILFYPKA